MVNLKKIEKNLKKLKTDKEKLDYLKELLEKLDDKKDKELKELILSLIKELEKREESGIERIAESAPSITRQREEIIEDIETDYAPLQPVAPLIIPQAPTQGTEEEAEGITYEGTTEYTPLETSDVVYTSLSMEGAIEQTPLERNPIHERVERRLRDERLITQGQLELTSEEKQALKGRVAEMTTMQERELTEYVDQLSERGLQEYELNKEFEEKTKPEKKYIKIEDKGR